MSLRSRFRPLFSRPHLWVIALLGVIVPRRLRAEWREEWEAELWCRERRLAEWNRLDGHEKWDLLRRSSSASSITSGANGIFMPKIRAERKKRAVWSCKRKIAGPASVL